MGISVAVILNDKPDVLARFRRKYGFPYVLLSDEDSAVIRSFGIFNTSYEPDSKYYGVPYPGVFLVSAQGTVIKKFAEESYRDRPAIDDLINSARELSR